MPTEYLQPLEKGQHTHDEMFEKVFDWTDQFCFDHDFFRKDGLTNFGVAWNLAMGFRQPRTKKERAFLDLFISEIERRFPGESYPKGCIRRVKHRPDLQVVS